MPIIQINQSFCYRCIRGAVEQGQTKMLPVLRFRFLARTRPPEVSVKHNHVLTSSRDKTSNNIDINRGLHLAPPFLVDEDYEPRAVRAHREGLLKPRVQEALAALGNCTLCPRLTSKPVKDENPPGEMLLIAPRQGLQGRPARRQEGRLQHRQEGDCQLSFSPLWRGVGLARLEWLGNHLLRHVQPQVCLLPELGHQSTEEWMGIERRRNC